MVPKSHRVPDEPLRWFAVKRRRGLLSYECRIHIASAAFSSYRPVDFAIRMASHFLRGRKKSRSHWFFVGLSVASLPRIASS